MIRASLPTSFMFHPGFTRGWDIVCQVVICYCQPTKRLFADQSQSLFRVAGPAVTGPQSPFVDYAGGTADLQQYHQVNLAYRSNWEADAANGAAKLAVHRGAGVS